ncbi:MAG: leucine-rich repeat protein [Eubacteriales bacterium]|nr:leucine-rich repeat protein [Eubacteriales bacterium]
MKLICAYKNQKEAVICRAIGASGELVLPETCCGLTLSELAPYAFSGADRGLPARTELFLLDQEAQAPVPAKNISPEAWEALLSGAVTGAKLLSLSLPRSLKKIGRYAFYNCSELHTLSIYSTTIDLGQGLFTGCSAVRRISAVVDEAVRSSLYELLSEFRYPLLLSYYIEDSAGSTRLKYRLVFPEFYENSDENTPARITVRDLHGSGLMYRNCFANTQFQVQRYDALFPYAEALEPEEICAALALCRLTVPEGLHDEVREKYAAWLSSHTDAAADALARQHAEGLISLSDIRDLLSSPQNAFERGTCSALLERLTASGTVALVPLLMELLRPKAAADRKEGEASGSLPAAPSGQTLKPAPKRRRHFEL